MKKVMTKIKVTRDGALTYANMPIGYVVEDYAVIDRPEYFRIESLLYGVRLLNKKAYKVIFDPRSYVEDPYYIINNTKRHSQDDVKTAVVAGYIITNMFTAKLYTYNQLVKGKMVHAEALLTEFIKYKSISPSLTTTWYMDLEPCEHCLSSMVEVGATEITYATKHKDKLNTPEYLVLRDSLKDKVRYKQKGLWE